MTLTVVLIVTTVLGPLITLWIEQRDDKEVSRRNEREKQKLLEIIRDQNDRIMHLAGSTWTPPPRDVLDLEEPMGEEEIKRITEGWRPF